MNQIAYEFYNWNFRANYRHPLYHHPSRLCCSSAPRPHGRLRQALYRLRWLRWKSKVGLHQSLLLRYSDGWLCWSHQKVGNDLYNPLHHSTYIFGILCFLNLEPSIAVLKGLNPGWFKPAGKNSWPYQQHQFLSSAKTIWLDDSKITKTSSHTRSIQRA